MSFTQDELQSFNTILEQRFTAHRQEMEQALEQRLQNLRQDIAQQLTASQQKTNNQLQEWLTEQENKFVTDFITGLSAQQDQLAQTFNQAGERQQQQIEAAMDRLLAAQLSSIEQLLKQYMLSHNLEQSTPQGDVHQALETIELQAELPWGDLVELIRKALDERLVWLDNSIQRSVKDLEQYLAVRLHSLHTQIEQSLLQGQSDQGSLDKVTSMQEVLGGIEQLEHIIESMQIAMTANQALLSNRLYHHQKLPLERAHPATRLQTSPLNGTTPMPSYVKEHLTSNLEAENADQRKEVEEPEG